MAHEAVWRTAAAIAPDRLEREGLAEVALRLSATADPELRLSAMRQAAHRLMAEREIGTVLGALHEARIEVAPWKGIALAPYWPADLRPIGDLDLLIRPAQLDHAVSLLETMGHRRAPEASAGLARRGPTGVELLPPVGRVVAVDLHTRPFRSVGHRIVVGPLLERARLGQVAGVEVLMLDPVDHVHLVLVHAAKHALLAAKWRLDIAALGEAVDRAELQQRARSTRTERPVQLALAAVNGHGGSALLMALVHRAWRRRALSRAERWALELLLEPGLLARARMVAGVLERLARRLD